MSSNVEAAASGRGRFITLEGGEGAGKSTQARLLVDRLAAVGVEAIATREPGGTPLAETYRTALLDGSLAPLGPAAEAIGFSAARIDHLDRKIVPALRSGCAVVCDRFVDSTRAYQGALGKLDPALVSALERVVVGRFMPDLTLILDLPAEAGMARAALRRSEGAAADRFERQDRAFHDSLRRAFLEIATRDHERCCIVDASRPPDAVADLIWEIVTARLYPRLVLGSGFPPPGQT